MTSSGARPRISSASKTDRWTAALFDVRPSDRVLWALALDPPSLAATLIDGVQLTHRERAQALREHGATVLVSTPTDALRLAEHARMEQVEVPRSTPRLVVVSGEPGGSVPSTRRRIEEQLGAHVRDVYATRELGPVGWQCPVLECGVHLDDSFDVDPADLAEAVEARCSCGRTAVVILGRKDDLLIVRGVQVLPATVENVVRRHPAVNEYRLDAYHVRGECELAIEIEPDEAVATEGDRARVAAEVAEDLKRSLGLRLQCEAVPLGSIPRDDPRPRRLVWRN